MTTYSNRNLLGLLGLLLLFLGVVMPTVLYLLWGLMEITQIPIAE